MREYNRKNWEAVLEAYFEYAEAWDYRPTFKDFLSWEKEFAQYVLDAEDFARERRVQLEETA